MYLSGSQKRKKVVAQKEVAEKLPKLTSLFTVDETNITDSSQDQNTSQFQQCNEQVIIEDPDVTAVSSDAEPSRSYCDFITTSRYRKLSPDPGMYSEITEELRNICRYTERSRVLPK